MSDESSAAQVLADVRTPCSRGGFITRDLPVTTDTLCRCGHPRSDHNMLWNACRGCPPKGKR